MPTITTVPPRRTRRSASSTAAVEPAATRAQSAPRPSVSRRTAAGAGPGDHKVFGVDRSMWVGGPRPRPGARRRCARCPGQSHSQQPQRWAVCPCPVLYEAVFLLFVQYGAARARGRDAAVCRSVASRAGAPGRGVVGVVGVAGDCLFRRRDAVAAESGRHGGNPRRGPGPSRAFALGGNHGRVQPGERQRGQAGGVSSGGGESDQPGGAVAGRFDPARPGTAARRARSAAGVRDGAGDRLRQRQRRSHVRPAPAGCGHVDAERERCARLAARASLGVWADAGCRQPVGGDRRPRAPR